MRPTSPPMAPASWRCAMASFSAIRPMFRATGWKTWPGRWRSRRNSMANLRHFGRMALDALFRNRTQTFLAMLGMTVGVAALVTSLALGRGAQEALNDQL